uniref:Uncharacterized protein n=1 Tax=Siphoviridae sp. cteLh2 TaxID=2825590 RepID=A0A8S5U5Y6_9CAUD|nr:MAG TPA: hypothetical protein [Siphoviridae sp. cteLh2]
MCYPSPTLEDGRISHIKVKSKHSIASPSYNKLTNFTLFISIIIQVICYVNLYLIYVVDCY